ncbi:hypothetical protein OHS33_27060 [Streptomyces sp. NBC_00536]|uniref:hypothetical protein n=1 Tax=Streptomyces sp. NBC_00536 TaxID=2975769 RepID=UPI002E8094D5|nr:hypothetical protein [Streptomyces sp. NBC_00536]WUC83923.1 hypothetical protein OHS33_27060 [Streptomyces sp. NBC_00536]
MEAGPRDTGRERDRQETDPVLQDGLDLPEDGLGLPAEPVRLTPDGPDGPDALAGLDGLPGTAGLPGGLDGLTGLDAADAAAAQAPEFEVELRPQRRLRIWQIAPIVMLAAAGSLMFAFPLAFEFGDGGAVVAMLGLLISSCAGGWGMMAARRVGYTWPGLPARGSGRRPDWRIAGLYAVVVLALAALAVLRVARLR